MNDVIERLEMIRLDLRGQRSGYTDIKAEEDYETNEVVERMIKYYDNQIDQIEKAIEILK